MSTMDNMRKAALETFGQFDIPPIAKTQTATYAATGHGYVEDTANFIENSSCTVVLRDRPNPYTPTLEDVLDVAAARRAEGEAAQAGDTPIAWDDVKGQFGL